MKEKGRGPDYIEEFEEKIDRDHFSLGETLSLNYGGSVKKNDSHFEVSLENSRAQIVVCFVINDLFRFFYLE